MSAPRGGHGSDLPGEAGGHNQAPSALPDVSVSRVVKQLRDKGPLGAEPVKRETPTQGPKPLATRR